jgi:hypothetical protein
MYAIPNNRSNRYNNYNDDSFEKYNSTKPNKSTTYSSSTFIDTSSNNTSSEYNNLINVCLLQTQEDDLKCKNQLLLSHTEALLKADLHINDRNNTIHILKQIIIEKNARIIELEKVIQKSTSVELETVSNKNTYNTYLISQINKLEKYYKSKTDVLNMKITGLQNELSHRIISSLECKIATK